MRPIDELREKIDLWKKSTTDTALMSVLHDVLKQIDVAIYEMDHQEAESPWHRVEDELPDDSRDVIIFTVSKIIGLGSLIGPNWYQWYSGGGLPVDVTHWMPLPEPPKEEEHGNK